MAGLGLDAILPGLGAVQSVIGAFGASARAKKAQDARERALNDYSAQLDREYQDTVSGNLTALRRAGGQLGDELRGYATDVGDASAAAGVYNSSAVAGAVAQQGASNARVLGDVSAQNYASERSLLHSNRRVLNDRRLGYADQDLAQAQADRGAAVQGVAGAIGGLGNYFQQRSLAGDRQKEKDQFFSTLQQMIQPSTGQSPGVQYGSARNNGIMMNGNQGSSLIKPRSLYSGGGRLTGGR
jgi:hypothetical protein